MSAPTKQLSLGRPLIHKFFFVLDRHGIHEAHRETCNQPVQRLARKKLFGIHMRWHRGNRSSLTLLDLYRVQRLTWMTPSSWYHLQIPCYKSRWASTDSRRWHLYIGYAYSWGREVLVHSASGNDCFQSWVSLLELVGVCNKKQSNSYGREKELVRRAAYWGCQKSFVWKMKCEESVSRQFFLHRMLAWLEMIPSLKN